MAEAQKEECPWRPVHGHERKTQGPQALSCAQDTVTGSSPRVHEMLPVLFVNSNRCGPPLLPSNQKSILSRKQTLLIKMEPE